MSKDNRGELARLIDEELEASGRGPSTITEDWPEGQVRAFYGWKNGSSAPLRKSRAMLEDALGWRRGVVTEILDAPITREFTLSEVRDWAKLPDPGAVKARDLSADDLLMELTRRVGALQSFVDAVKAEESAQSRDQHHYDLAASDEHVPGEDDND